jgi:hypothetical protein
MYLTRSAPGSGIGARPAPAGTRTGRQRPRIGFTSRCEHRVPLFHECREADHEVHIVGTEAHVGVGQARDRGDRIDAVRLNQGQDDQVRPSHGQQRGCGNDEGILQQRPSQHSPKSAGALVEVHVHVHRDCPTGRRGNEHAPLGEGDPHEQRPAVRSSRVQLRPSLRGARIHPSLGPANRDESLGHQPSRPSPERRAPRPDHSRRRLLRRRGAARPLPGRGPRRAG